jgi:hypothetical protein
MTDQAGAGSSDAAQIDLADVRKRSLFGFSDPRSSSMARTRFLNSEAGAIDVQWSGGAPARR